MGDLGKSDDEVIHAMDEMLHALISMVNETDMPQEYVEHLPKAKDFHLQQALCLDPKKISEEYDRIRTVAIETGEDGDILAKAREARDHLVGWQGKAAQAFRSHMDHMENFATETQHEAVMVALQILSALFGIAYHMRQSCYDLALFTKAAAEHEIDESHERADQLKLAIGLELVKTAFDMSAANFRSAGVGFVVESAKALDEYAFGGDGDVIINEYLHKGKQLAESFADEFQQLIDNIDREYLQQAKMQLAVLTPINKAYDGVTDITGPNFSYANFYTEEYPKDGPFVGQVEEERKKYAEEKHGEDSEISKRLGGGG